MENSSSKNIKIGAILTYLTQFLSIAISFVYVPIMLSKLGQSEYGLYSIVQSLISYLHMSEMGIGTTATRYNSKYIGENNIAGQRVINGMFFKMYLGIAGICLVVSSILFFFLDDIYAKYSAENIQLIKTLFVIAVINLILTFVFQIFNAIVIAYERFIFLKILTLLQTVLGPCGMLLVLFLGARSIGMLCVTTVITLLFGLTQMVFCLKEFKIRFSFKGHDSKLFKTILSFTLFVFMNSLANQLLLNTDKIVISIVMTETAVAIYAIVMQFHTYSYNFSNVLSGFYLPKFTKAMVKTKTVNHQVMSELISTGRLQVFVAGLIFGGFLAIGKPFILRWVGVSYNEAYWLTVIVLVTEVFGAAQSMYNALMQAMNLHKMRSVLTLTAAIIKVPITVLMTMKFGLMGCAVAYSITWFMRFAIYNIYYKKRVGIDIKLFWKEMAKMLIPLAVIVVALYILVFFALKIVPATSYPLLLVYIALYAVLYVGCMWVFVLKKEEKNLFSGILKKFKKA